MSRGANEGVFVVLIATVDPFAETIRSRCAGSWSWGNLFCSDSANGTQDPSKPKN